jgi:hypothetical protein
MRCTKALSQGLLFCCILQSKSFSQKIEYYKDADDKTIYTVMQNAWKVYQPLTYVSLFPSIKPSQKRILDLIEGEGKNGTFIEGNIYQAFEIIKGRHQTTHAWQTFRATFDFGSNFRMTNDDSHLVLPQSYKAGIGIDKILWDNKTNFGPFKKCLTYSQQNWIDNEGNSRTAALRFVSLGIKVMHYSNGQTSGFFRDPVLRRNDYKKGDFSTNYIQARFYYTKVGVESDMLIASLGYQWDGSFGGPFSYSKEQEKSYGHHRLQGLFQYNFKPKITKARTQWTDLSTNTTYNIPKTFHEFSIRLEPEFILDGNLSLYPHSNKARFGSHAYLMYTTFRLRTMGFTMHAYYGRDYLNIRYDDVIFSLQFGLTLSLKKYSPPIAVNKYIVKERLNLAPSSCPPILH